MAQIEQLQDKVAELRRYVETIVAGKRGMIGIEVENLASLGWIKQKQDELLAEANGKCLPTGGKFIGMFNVSCPAGWSPLTAMIDRFPRGAATYGGTGGAATHTHTYDDIASHTHAPGFDIAAGGGSHTHSYSVSTTSASIDYDVDFGFMSGTTSNNTSPDGAHTHGVAGTSASEGEASGTTSAGGSLPVYTNLVFCSRN